MDRMKQLTIDHLNKQIASLQHEYNRRKSAGDNKIKKLQDEHTADLARLESQIEKAKGEIWFLEN